MGDSKERPKAPADLRTTGVARTSGDAHCGEPHGLSEKELRLIQFPLSHAQERLWFLDQLGAASAYNMGFLLRLEGNLDESAVERSFAQLVRRHGSLRTHFRSHGGVPSQSEDVQGGRFGWSSVDHRDLRGVEHPHLHTEEFLSREYLRPFNLASDALLRAILVRTGHQEHLLLVVTHHIVSDGLSLQVLRKELAALYCTVAHGHPDTLMPLQISYAEYAARQRAPAHAERIKRELAYWRDKLQTAPRELELPTDRPRPSTASFRGGEVSVQVESSMLTSLKRLARREHVTLFMLLLAAFQALLSRWSGQSDVIVGAPIAGRSSPELEGVIGLFVNVLLLRTHIGNECTFTQLLRQIRDEVAIDAYGHQNVPFEEIVRELAPERSLARLPFLQAVLTLQDAPEPHASGGIVWSPVHLQRRVTNFDVSLLLYQSADRLFGRFEYASDLFEHSTVERLASQFGVLLQSAVEQPDSIVSRLRLLSHDDERQVVADWNATARDFPSDRTVHQLFEERVKRSPDAIAVQFAQERLTYSDLNSRADELARHLLARGVQPGELVPLLLPRGLAMLVSQLAVLKAGGAYVPIGPELPPQRQAYIIGDCRARRVVAHVAGEWCGVAPPVSTELIDEAGRLPSQAARAGTTQPAVSAGCTAYVMYTSGSTGMPKGVIVPHRAITRLVMNANYIDVRETDCLAHSSNPAFDASTFEIWGALLNGARLVILPHQTVLSPDQYRKTLTETGVTVLWMTTGLFKRYVEELSDVFSRMRYLIIGGEVVSPVDVNRLLRGGRPVHFLNAYGPTECTTFASMCEVTEKLDEMRTVPIGRPISNTQIYILDRWMQPVPIGVTGELHIGGPGVATGYLNRAALTAEKFVPDPFGEPGARMYRTGDLGRWRADGSIEYVGRSDEQLKIRGFRIEPGEIESRLREHPCVSQAAVIARQDESGERRLIAYVTLQHPPEAPDAETLQAHLKARLPEYMIPSAFVILGEMPLTANGKLDRRALPAPLDGSFLRKTYEAPVSDTECAVATIWQELLAVDRVGRNDDFFDLGGHSLLMAQMGARVEARLSVTLSLTSMFEHSTVASISKAIDETRGNPLHATSGSSEDQRMKLRKSVAEMPEAEVRDLLQRMRMERRP